MITIETKAGRKKIVLQLYSGIKELPVTRYKLLQQYLLQDSGIGSTISDIDERLGKTINYLEHSKPDEAKEELANLRYSFFTTLSGIDFRSKAFACLVFKINGVEKNDLSSEGIAEVVEVLSQLTVEELDQHWESIKKKLIPNYEPTSLDISEMTSNTLKT